MSKLRELERRLREEPGNLGLRVMVAGALHDAGRRDDAVDLYRSVAVAYRDQGRPQQAITVCRSILEIAPDDRACHELLAALLASQAAPREGLRAPSPQPVTAAEPRSRSPSPTSDAWPSAPARSSPGRLSPPTSVPRPSPLPLPRPSSPSPSELVAPARRSSGDVTPLPQPLPYHVADPTSSSRPRLRSEPPPSLPDHLAGYPEIVGIANAARQISASLIAASPPDDDDDELPARPDTGRVPRTGIGALPAFDPQLITAVDGDDDPTLPPRSGVFSPGRADEETTELRERPRARPPSIAPPTAATDPLASVFFAPVPPHNRTAVLQRFRRRLVAAGTTVIRRGESGHGLVLVARGRLDVRGERANGSSVALAEVGPGDYAGEAGLLARAPAAAHVVAATESEILVLSAGDFYEITSAFPGLWTELSDVADRRAREHARRLSG